MSTKNLLAVIPARGGSKRIPHKNIRNFGGKPLLAYSIDAALQSGLFSKIVVSTDDPEIAETAQKCGALVPFMRDPQLADDYTGTYAVTVDAYKRMQSQNFDAVCCIYATAPLLTASYLQKAYAFFVQEKADFLYACCEFPFPVQRAQYLDEHMCPTPIMPECMASRSQDLPKAYQDAGLFYFHSIADLTNNYAGRTPVRRGFIMPRHRVIDIDTPEDWAYAQAMAHAVEELKLE